MFVTLIFDRSPNSLCNNSEHASDSPIYGDHNELYYLLSEKLIASHKIIGNITANEI